MAYKISYGDNDCDITGSALFNDGTYLIPGDYRQCFCFNQFPAEIGIAILSALEKKKKR
jgi:hypothetical protein